MKLAMVGLGKMGANMVRRLILKGHQVIGFNLVEQVTRDLATETGMVPVFALADIVSRLEPPRIIWVMVPAGEATEQVIMDLSKLLSPGDVLIDGGNSNYRDTVRRAKILTELGIHFVDAGVSGGVWGLKEGYSLMVGGDEEAVASLRPIFESLAPAPDQGWGRVGPNGAGHFVKMVHNGIEYGMMEALAEGFEIMRSKTEFDMNLYEISKIWQYGSVVRSWLLDLTSAALEKDPELTNIEDWVADSGEGRWTVMEAIDGSVPAPVITLSLFQRFRSRQEQSYAGKLLAAMRNQFGGHEMKIMKNQVEE